MGELLELPGNHVDGLPARLLATVVEMRVAQTELHLTGDVGDMHPGGHAHPRGIPRARWPIGRFAEMKSAVLMDGEERAAPGDGGVFVWGVIAVRQPWGDGMTRERLRQPIDLDLHCLLHADDIGIEFIECVDKQVMPMRP